MHLLFAFRTARQPYIKTNQFENLFSDTYKERKWSIKRKLTTIINVLIPVFKVPERTLDICASKDTRIFQKFIDCTKTYSLSHFELVTCTSYIMILDLFYTENVLYVFCTPPFCKPLVALLALICRINFTDSIAIPFTKLCPRSHPLILCDQPVFDGQWDRHQRLGKREP